MRHCSLVARDVYRSFVSFPRRSALTISHANYPISPAIGVGHSACPPLPTYSFTPLVPSCSPRLPDQFARKKKDILTFKSSQRLVILTAKVMPCMTNGMITAIICHLLMLRSVFFCTSSSVIQPVFITHRVFFDVHEDLSALCCIAVSWAVDDEKHTAEKHSFGL